MAPSVQRYFQAGLAPSTQRTYAGALRRFHAFCTHINVYDPFPVSELLLCSFAAYLADQGLSPQTIKTYLAAVRSVQISLGLPDPRDQSSLPILKRVQAGISRCRLYRKQPTKVRLPLTAEVLLRIQQAPALVSHSNRPVIWAVAAVAFFGFFRLGELLPAARASFHEETDLSWGDVAVDGHETPQMVKVHLKKSKCDQFGKGVDIYLGRTDTVLCPVKALLTYIEWRGSQPGPFFLDSSKAGVTKPWFITQLRTILEGIGLPHQDYASHSFRIGAATTAALVGLDDSSIQLLGRWQSAAFLRYIRTPGSQLAALSATLTRNLPRNQHPPPSK